MIAATVSGSFHRHMTAIYEAVGNLLDAGVEVLSPCDPRIVAEEGDFLYVASDRYRSVRLVQDRHLHSIRASSFLWLVTPDGYVGASASMELGFAYASGIPVFSDWSPSDITLRQYVTQVKDIRHALLRVEERSNTIGPNVLLDPSSTIESAHAVLDDLLPRLLGTFSIEQNDPEACLRGAQRFMQATFGQTRKSNEKPTAT